jgi:parvulin-like peptidyl-prolyl isomerase
MKPARLLALLLLVLSVAVAAGCGGSDDSVPSDAVAVVDGQEVPKSALDDLMKVAKVSYTAQKREFPKAGTPEYQSLQSQAVAFLVQRVEYRQQAEELGVEVTEKELDERIELVRRENFGGSDAKLRAQITQQGYTTETFREAVEAELLADKIYDQVTKNVKVSEADARAYYNQNKTQYEVPESRDVRHILVKSKDRANDIYDQLRAGGDFAALAKQYSLDPGSKDDGGKLTISRGQTVGPFDTTAFLLPEGSISRPVKTEFGYHVIQALSAVKPAQTTKFAEVKASIEKQLIDQKKNDVVTKWLADVEKEYEGKISYAEGFAPPELESSGTETESDG